MIPIITIPVQMYPNLSLEHNIRPKRERTRTTVQMHRRAALTVLGDSVSLVKLWKLIRKTIEDWYRRHESPSVRFCLPLPVAS